MTIDKEDWGRLQARILGAAQDAELADDDLDEAARNVDPKLSPSDYALLVKDLRDRGLVEAEVTADEETAHPLHAHISKVTPLGRNRAHGEAVNPVGP